MRTTKINIINDNTGEWGVSFYEDGKICKALEVDLKDISNQKARQYSAYGLVFDDIKLLLKWARQLHTKVNNFEKKQKNILKTKNFNVIQEKNGKNEKIQNELFLAFAAISIIHGRLFSSNKSRRLSLARKVCVDRKYYHIHDELMKIRNEYIAHSSNKMYEESKVFVILNPKNESQFCVVYYALKFYFFTSKFVDEIINYFDDLSKKIKIKHDELNLDIEEQYRKDQLNYVNQ